MYSWQDAVDRFVKPVREGQVADGKVPESLASTKSGEGISLSNKHHSSPQSNVAVTYVNMHW